MYVPPPAPPDTMLSCSLERGVGSTKKSNPVSAFCGWQHCARGVRGDGHAQVEQFQVFDFIVHLLTKAKKVGLCAQPSLQLLCCIPLPRLASDDEQVKTEIDRRAASLHC